MLPSSGYTRLNTVRSSVFVYFVYFVVNYEAWPVSNSLANCRPVPLYIYIFPNLIKVEIKLKLISLVKAFSKTHGRSVEGGKTALKAFKNGEENPWDATLE